MNDRHTMRIAAVGDLHRDNNDNASFQRLFNHAAENADVLLLCGDLTDYGLPDEAKLLAAELIQVKIPVIAVLGNHDFESGQSDAITHILSDVGVKVLDGQGFQLGQVGFAGVKGFGGGFGTHTLEPWGETAIKSFVQEAVSESLKLELALSRLRVPWRIGILHYSPIAATVAGEPLEIYPFLGSSRLEEPLNRYHVSLAFHGHAHRGALEGKTRDGTPVYNVSYPLLRRAMPDQPPIRIIELPLVDSPEENGKSRHKDHDYAH
jgi:Icc-related predicted phosphoesterase